MVFLRLKTVNTVVKVCYGESDMKLIGLLVLVFSINAQAVCYTVGDLEGVQVRKNDNYAYDNSAFSGQEFRVTIKEKGSFVDGYDGSHCEKIAANTLWCSAGGVGSDKAVFESWTIDALNKKVVYMKSTSGYGGFDGGTMFVGEVRGYCD
jgi:hypothetical protein